MGFPSPRNSWKFTVSGSFVKNTDRFRWMVFEFQAFQEAFFFILMHMLGVAAPSWDASDHQDYCIFRIGDSYRPSFATGILEGSRHT